MKDFKLILVFGLIILLTQIGLGQQPDSNGVTAKTVDKSIKSGQQSSQTDPVSRERRAQAYAKLLEGQRHIWNITQLSPPTVIIRTGARLAREALEKAVELNPNLTEAYTALAELTYNFRVSSEYFNEAETLAKTAIGKNPDNFGGHLILAKIYTEKSQINRGILDTANAQKAITAWKEVVRFDPRNAEGFAFLSEFYGQTGKTAEQIEALKEWISSATPIDTSFYRRMLGRQEQLTPERAMVKLGAVYINESRFDDAVEILSRAIADNPNNDETNELLGKALQQASVKSMASAIESLQQAVFANPDNQYLITMLAKVQSRSGDFESATKLLRDSILKFNDTDKSAAADLQIVLGDIYQSVKRNEEAAANYKTALAIRGIELNELIRDEDRKFAFEVYEKLIQTYKNANRPDDVKDVISQARILFGDNDLFADKM